MYTYTLYILLSYSCAALRVFIPNKDEHPFPSALIWYVFTSTGFETANSALASLKPC